MGRGRAEPPSPGGGLGGRNLHRTKTVGHRAAILARSLPGRRRAGGAPIGRAGEAVRHRAPVLVHVAGVAPLRSAVPRSRPRGRAKPLPGALLASAADRSWRARVREPAAPRSPRVLCVRAGTLCSAWGARGPARRTRQPRWRRRRRTRRSRRRGAVRHVAVPWVLSGNRARSGHAEAGARGRADRTARSAGQGLSKGQPRARSGQRQFDPGRAAGARRERGHWVMLMRGWLAERAEGLGRSRVGGDVSRTVVNLMGAPDGPFGVLQGDMPARVVKRPRGTLPTVSAAARFPMSVRVARRGGTREPVDFAPRDVTMRGPRYECGRAGASPERVRRPSRSHEPPSLEPLRS